MIVIDQLAGSPIRMVKRQIRMVTGLTGLLAATGINALLNDHGDAWVGSAYAQDGESWDEDADSEAIEESSAEEAAADEPMAESAATEDASGTEEEESAPVDAAGSADDSASMTAADAPADEPAAEEPGQSGAAPAAAIDAPTEAPPQEGSQPEIASTAPDSTRQKIRAYILKNFLFSSDNAALGDRDSLIRGGILDSTGIYELIMWIEEQFGLTIVPEEMIPDNFDTLERMEAFIARKKP